ncbi:MAG TPA: T9SS type A sorting domain-containing protein, partial [Chitinophagaceae bacterium]|nr:T9SS type A sorting domain-containing protein [Chitinophagaceae bacterium]
CIIPPFSKDPVYYGNLYISGGCSEGTYTIYAVDPATGLANGTVLPASGVYTGALVSFSYTPFPGVTDVRFRIKVNCEGKECISRNIDVSLKQYPCREMERCDMDSKWDYFQCYRPSDPYFAAKAIVFTYTSCDPVNYTIMAIDPVTGMTNGSVSPASGSIPSGGYPVLFNYYPNPGVTAVKFIIILNCEDRVCYGTLGTFDKLNDRERYPCEKLERITSENGTTGAGTNKTSMQIAPNPANSHVNISFDIPEWKQGDVFKIHVFNLMGQSVAEYSINTPLGNWAYNTLQLSSGTYLVRLVKNGGNVAVQRMIIAH